MNKMSAKYKILNSLLENPLSVTANGSASIRLFFCFYNLGEIRHQSLWSTFGDAKILLRKVRHMTIL